MAGIPIAEQIQYKPLHIWQGLMGCERSMLTTLLSMLEKGNAYTLIWSRALDAAAGTKRLAKSITAGSVIDQSVKDAFAEQVSTRASDLECSTLSDDELRCAVLEYLLAAFDLSDEVVLCPRDAERVCNDIAHELTKAVASQNRKQETSISQRINPFAKKAKPEVRFTDAASWLVTHCTLLALEQMDNGINVEGLEVKESTDKAVTGAVAASGGLIGLMASVEAAGFGAYILAAKASAIIPLVGGKTLVSLLFVISNPFFVVPAILATGAWSKSNLDLSLRRSIGSTIATVLIAKGATNLPKLQKASKFLDQYPVLLQQLVDQRFSGDAFTSKFQSLDPVFSRIIVPELQITDEDLRFLETAIATLSNSVAPPDTSDPRQPTKIPREWDLAAVAGLTFGDFIYDLAAVDPKVLEAVDFARKADLSSVFDFALFADQLIAMQGEGFEAKFEGNIANLQGYVAERMVAAQLAREGYIVEIPESSTQPGYDLLVDGVPFQVKCLAETSFGVLERHFEKYPDIPVLVNFEMSELIYKMQPDWLELVFYVEGYTHEATLELLNHSMSAGQELGDYDVVGSIAVVSLVRNSIDWKQGRTSLQSATFNIALDTATKGTMAVSGGIAGAGIGMLMFGPAGAYILGGISSVIGAGQGEWLKTHVDKVLVPERDEALKTAANQLLHTCSINLHKKITLLEKKIERYKEHGLGNFIRHRLGWERFFVLNAINKNGLLYNDTSLSGIRKVEKALKLASESRVHPYHLQAQFHAIAELLQSKVDRTNRIVETYKTLITKNKKT